MTSVEHLNRVNEVLDRMYNDGTWRGVESVVNLTTTGGILTLSASYIRLNKLAIPAQNIDVPVRPMGFQFSPNGPMAQDFTLYGPTIALDQGETSGQRKYQITGDTATLDTITFRGWVAARFTYITDTSTVVVPDCFPALRIGVLALGKEDAGAISERNTLWSDCIRMLNGNLQEFQPDFRQVHVQPAFAMGSNSGIH